MQGKMAADYIFGFEGEREVVLGRVDYDEGMVQVHRCLDRTFVPKVWEGSPKPFSKEWLDRYDQMKEEVDSVPWELVGKLRYHQYEDDTIAGEFLIERTGTYLPALFFEGEKEGFVDVKTAHNDPLDIGTIDLNYYCFYRDVCGEQLEVETCFFEEDSFIAAGCAVLLGILEDTGTPADLADATISEAIRRKEG